MDQPTRPFPSEAIDPSTLARPRCRPRYSPGFDRLEDRVLPASAIPMPFPGRQSGTVAEAPAVLSR